MAKLKNYYYYNVMPKGVGEKEKDGSLRDTALYCLLPKWKILAIKEIAKQKGVSKTDIISEAVDLYIANNTLYKREGTDI